MKVSFIFLLLASIAGCSSLPISFSSSENAELPREQYTPRSSNYSIHHYTEQLAEKLFMSLSDFKPYGRIAVGTFTPVETLTHSNNKNSPVHLVGLQLEEGLMSSATQRGFTVIEYKTMPIIKMTKSSDLMLSRNVADLQAQQHIDYFLTGTLTQQERSIVVNARLINIETREVIAAATHFVPANIFWAEEKVISRNGVVSRTAY
ncbi:FlgO family outer membrane protein [Flocculibacter collagenilyticus]|uniref:FlgO family outer membrane protein n=1 Tax=Flocculibacter collagenilyticus TaxID=2744479 RepID=UPI0018F3495D|nr:FlgO family outer membrane protein [Flocculibacter collagenilyticus]